MPSTVVAELSDSPAQGVVDAAALPMAAEPAALPPPRGMLPAQCAQALRERFGALFGAEPKPIKLGIQADIQQRAPGVFTRKALSAFLHRYTTSTPYLLALTRNAQRFDLDGQPAGPVSDEHRQAADEELRRRRALVQQRRVAEQRERQNQAQLLRQLLRDFEHTTLTRANFCALKGLTEAELEPLLQAARQVAAQRAQAARAGDAPRRQRAETAPSG